VERRVDLSNVDLDAAATAIAQREASWRTRGFSIAAMTWTNNEDDWPRPVRTDRARVRRPMSLRLELRRADGAEVEFEFYAGGWADVGTYDPTSGTVWQNSIELESSDNFGPLLDEVVAHLPD
jgi:hypothetical protein